MQSWASLFLYSNISNCQYCLNSIKFCFEKFRGGMAFPCVRPEKEAGKEEENKSE